MKKTLLSLLGAAALAVTPAKGNISAFSATQSGLTDQIPVGMSQTASDLYLTGADDSAKLAKSYSGNNQDTFAFNNPATMKDAATFDNSYALQLGTDNTLYKVKLSDGTLAEFSPSNFGISAGANAFGVGKLGNDFIVGYWNGSELSTRKLDSSSWTLGSAVTYDFNSATYGTPTGLDGAIQGSSERLLLGTQDGNSDLNHILDYDANTGSFSGQGLSITGSAGNLQDLTYSNGRLDAGMQFNGNDGFVATTNYTPVPEPAQIAALLGLGALGAAAYRRRKE